ncbi:MAG: hypothetical protein JST02_01085 [Bacteroidetes bacterium]|nr:hypothetical protein [Bacteroidota bacterium]
MKKSITFLIGAGFSAPKGYPIGSQLNNSILNCTGEEFAFSSGGTLAMNTDGTKPDWGYQTAYDIQFELCKKLISLYHGFTGGFDYEEFYDYLRNEAAKDKRIEPELKQYMNGYSSLEQIINPLDNIYSQIVGYYLKDSTGNSWHDNEGHACGPIYPGYTGILNCLYELKKTHKLNIHTLNHDIFLESLNSSDWLEDELCDGFEELGSQYYGEMRVKGRNYKVRLSRYTGNYDKNICLHKLHGSRDYAVYYASDKNGIGRPENYVKIRYGIGFGDIYKEEVKNNQLTYEHCFINSHADFLTGTTSKIERYQEPTFYKKLFEIFKGNLQEAEKLIIIGYGCKDTEINKLIIENFDFKNKPVTIIDPYPSQMLENFRNQVNGVLIEKDIDNVSISDIQ